MDQYAPIKRKNIYQLEQFCNDRKDNDYHFFQFPSLERGVYVIRSWRLVSRFPLGLWSWYIEGHHDEDQPSLFMYVGPKKIKQNILNYQTQNQVNGVDGGELSKENGEFIQHENFQYGSMKDIDWKVYAKTDQLKTKFYHQYDKNVVFLFQKKPEYDWEKLLEDLAYWCERKWNLKQNFQIVGPYLNIKFDFERKNSLEKKYKHLIKFLAECA
jgi:hypothetical protein